MFKVFSKPCEFQRPKYTTVKTMNTIMNEIKDEERKEDEHTNSIPSHPTKNNNNEESNINNNNNKPLAETAFRQEEKKYKLYKPTKVGKKLIPAPETDFSEVLDFRKIDSNTEENKKMIRRVTTTSEKTNDDDDDEKSNSPLIYTFDGLPGLVFLPNYLSESEQRYWMQRSLTEFSGTPYPNNETTLVKNEHDAALAKINDDDEKGKQELLKKEQEVLNRRGYRNGLRWATLGYTYNWSTKTYHPDQKSPFPQELASLVKKVVHEHFASAFPPLSQDLAKHYEGQTSIVNYFPVGAQMCAHQDVSEAAMEKPLVSISLGCSSVFLMGTSSREDKPFAMFLRSGDVVVFSGKTRDAFHAVPRILDDCPSHFFRDDENENEKVPPGLRVNINVRQVFDEKNGPESLPDMKEFYCMKTANALKRKQQQEE